MKRVGVCLSAALAVAFGVLIASGSASAIEQGDFELETGTQFVALCGASESDPLYREAQLVCYGFLEGASQFHDALTHGDQFDRYYCEDRAVSRDEAVDIIVAFIKATPEKANNVPVELAVEAFATKFPCS